MPVELTYLKDPKAPERIAARAARELAASDFRPVREPSNTHHQHHRPSWYWMATTGVHVTTRSRLAERNLRLLDFDPVVRDVCAEPFVAHAGARTAKGRTPDFLVALADGRVRVVDVMSDHARTRRASRAHVKLMRSVCSAAGWEYELLGEPPEPLSSNLAWLAGYRRPLNCLPAFAAAVLDSAAEPHSVVDLIEAAGGPPALVRPVIYHLLWHQQLSCRLDERLEDTTMVWSSSAAS